MSKFILVENDLFRNKMLEQNLDALNLKEFRIYSTAYMTFYLETKLNNNKSVRTPNIAYKGVKYILFM